MTKLPDLRHGSFSRQRLSAAIRAEIAEKGILLKDIAIACGISQVSVGRCLASSHASEPSFVLVAWHFGFECAEYGHYRRTPDREVA